MNTTLEPTATTEASHTVSDRRSVTLESTDQPQLSEAMAVEIALAIGVTRQRVEELWADGRLTRKGLDWSLATDLAAKRHSTVAEIDSQIVALFGGDSKDLSESIKLQKQADELAEKAAAHRDAAIQKRQAHTQLMANVQKAREELQSVADNEAGISGLITELKDVVSRMARGIEIIPRRAQWPPSELAGAIQLQKELPAIRKSAESAVAKAEKALSQFETANGITTTPTEQEAA